MRIFVEGPWWAGRWTGITLDTLRALGHEVAVYHHNRKTPADRARLAAENLQRLYGARPAGWPALARRHLRERLLEFHPDLFLSIQGKLDPATAQDLRQQLPHMKMVFWWGDILTPPGRQNIEQAAGWADRLLVSYRGIHDRLAPGFGDRLLYFPFAAAPGFHTPEPLTGAGRSRLAAEVAFVGTCYPERCELVRYLNARLDEPVRVWGRGWRRCRGVRGRGALDLADAIRVYANARVTINLHHHDTDNGCNMKFYEIPAAGGYQVCDWQPVLQDTRLGRLTTACRTPEQFLDRIRHALRNPAQRNDLAGRAQAEVLANETYENRFTNLFKQLY